MNPAEQQLAEDRAIRDAARAVFDTRLGRIRGALASRSVPQRIKSEATSRAVSGIDEAVAVAKDNRVIVAGTTLALVAWLARRPLGRWAGKRLQEWTAKRTRT